MSQDKGVDVKRSLLDRLLDGIERVGNKLPNPITMFIWLSVIVAVLSCVCSLLGVSAVNPADGKTVTIMNLISADGIRYLWSNVITNYSGFAPLGMVLVAIIGTSVAEKSGFLITVMQSLLGGTKGWVVTMIVVFLGINLNLAGDSGFIILPPLAAVLFMSVGRHPLLGLYTGFTSVAAGFCANCMLGLSDALAYGFTEPAARMINPNYTGSMAINYYFMFTSCIILTIAGTFLVEKVLLKRFPITGEQLAKYEFKEDSTEVSPVQKQALKKALLGLLVFMVVIVLMSVPVFGGRALLADESGSLTASGAPFTKGIVFTCAIAFFIPGVIYGVCTDRYTCDKDVWKDISLGFSEMGNYVFMCFFISIFTNFFGVTKLGTVLAIDGADFLKTIGFKGIPLMIGLIVLSSIVNIFIGSASAKWAILAPVFVPMMMLLGYDPALTQAIYRIGDALTNPLSPLFTYTPVLLGFARKYDEKVGLGTVIANALPFSVTFAIVWIIQVIVWVMLNLPLGPGGNIYL